MTDSHSGSEGTGSMNNNDGKRFPLAEMAMGELTFWPTDTVCQLVSRVRESDGTLRQPAVHQGEQPTHIVVIGENDLPVGKVSVEANPMDRVHDLVNLLVDEEVTSL